MGEAFEEGGLWRFGVFELNMKSGELRKKGTRVALQPQPCQVLATLVERAGDVVTREELRARLWPDVVFVDFDQALNTAVLKIRRALGDVAESPRYVETLEGRGYRFLAAAERIDRQAADVGGGESAPVRIFWDNRSVALSSGANLIGRDPGTLIRIDSPDVSRRHAQLLVGGGHAVLQDLGSKNGTFVNERRVDAPVALNDGDVIRIGRAALIFRSAPAGRPTRSSI